MRRDPPEAGIHPGRAGRAVPATSLPYTPRPGFRRRPSPDVTDSQGGAGQDRSHVASDRQRTQGDVAMLKRPILIAAGLAGLVLLAGPGGAYAHFFSGLRNAPKPLALGGSPPAAASPAHSGSSATTLAGGRRGHQGSLAAARG